MDNKKSMAVWKPKMPLDDTILGMINSFYGVSLDESVCGIECFSHPSLTAHECNPEAKLLGGVDCQFCGHVFDRVCKVTCHLSRFCLMVFAYRLGIGGESFEDSLAYTASISYETLYGKVQKRLRDLEEYGPDFPVSDCAQTSFPFSLANTGDVPIQEIRAVLTEAEVDEYITFSEAAEMYGCSYVNIYSHVKRGNLKAVTVRGMKRVKKADVLSLKELNGKV